MQHPPPLHVHPRFRNDFPSRALALNAPAAPCIRAVLILKANKMIAALLQQGAQAVFPAARIRSVHTLAQASAELLMAPVDLLITGVEMVDGDVVDFLFAHTGETRRVEKILVVTTRRDQRLLSCLSTLPIHGVFDPTHEDPSQLAPVLALIAAGVSYWSSNVLQHLSERRLSKNTLWTKLTPAEELVLSVIGDGCDDATAAELLGRQPSTIATCCRELHRKLDVQTRGELVRAAAQRGYVHFLPDRVERPGFATMLAISQARKKRTEGSAQNRKTERKSAVVAFTNGAPSIENTPLSITPILG